MSPSWLSPTAVPSPCRGARLRPGVERPREAQRGPVLLGHDGAGRAGGSCRELPPHPLQDGGTRKPGCKGKKCRQKNA